MRQWNVKTGAPRWLQTKRVGWTVGAMDFHGFPLGKHPGRGVVVFFLGWGDDC